MKIANHMRLVAGLTLIELLVSISIGMLLLAMGSTALVHVSRIVKRDVAQRQAHEDVGALSRNLRVSLGSLHHGSLMRLEAYEGDDGVWGSGDEVITTYWMAHLRDRTSRWQGFGRPYDREVVWTMLRWTGDVTTPAVNDGTLYYAVSSDRIQTESRTIPDETGANRTRQFNSAAQWRRDRRRSMSDNDGRYIDGMTPTLLADIDMLGDAGDLNSQALPAHAPTTKILDFAVEWVDAGGQTVRCDANGGVSVDGSALAPDPSRPWQNQTGYSVDGLYGDGRVVTSADSTRSNVGQRPTLMRFRFVAVPLSNSGVTVDDEPHLPFSLTFNTTTNLPFIAAP